METTCTRVGSRAATASARKRICAIATGTLVGMALALQQNVQAMAIPALIAAVSVALIGHGRSASTVSRTGVVRAPSKA